MLRLTGQACQRPHHKLISMRILIHGLNFYPELTGVGKYSGEMAEYLQGQGHLLRVITSVPYYPEWKKPEAYRKFKFYREEWQGIQVIRCPIYVPGKGSGLKRFLHLGSFAVLSIFPLIRSIGFRPDIIISIAPTLISAPFSLLLAKIIRKPAWLHIQDFEIDAAFNLKLLPNIDILTRITFWIEKRIYRSFDYLSTISRDMLAFLREKAGPDANITLFQNWVNTKEIHPTGNDFRKDFGFGEDQFIVLYAGNIGSKQGLSVIIDIARALADNPHIQFVFCGEGVGKESLVQMSRGLANVHFFPLQPFEKLNDLLNMADLHIITQRAAANNLVLPSKLSGMFASGKPVLGICERDTELADTIQAVGIFVEAGAQNEAVAAIDRLYNERDYANRLGKQGREFAEKNWEKEKILGQMNALLLGIQEQGEHQSPVL